MQKTGGQRSRDQRGGERDGDRDRDRDRDRADKDGFRSALPRPDVAALKREIASHDKEISACNKELSEIKSKQDKIRNERNGGRQEFDNAKRKMGKLMEAKKALHAEKNTIEASREASHKKIGAGQDKEKAAKSAIKFSSVEAIDKQVAELSKRQAHTSMSLTEEKNLVKEIQTLTLSKKSFASLQELKAATDRERALKSGIDKAYTEKNLQLKEIYKQVDAQKLVLDGLNKNSSESGKLIPEFKKRQEELRALVETQNAAVKTLRLQIKEKESEHAVAVAAEKTLFLEDQAERKKKEEEAELARHPYEEEMHICDFLVTYLSTKFVADSKGDSPSTATTTATAPSADSVSAFAGMKSLKRDDDETFMGGVVKKKGKKKGGQNSKEDITHTHESLEQFSSIGVTAPAKISSVSETLTELAQKKEYFNGLQRGAIPSLKTIRAKKNNAKAVGGSGGKSDKKAASKKTIFNMESKSEYPGLWALLVFIINYIWALLLHCLPNTQNGSILKWKLNFWNFFVIITAICDDIPLKGIYISV